MVKLMCLHGQTSNNFFQHIHLDAFCRANNLRFSSPDISIHYEEYPNLRTAGYESSKRWTKILKKLKLITKVNFDDETKRPEYRRLLLEKRWVLCEGWYFWTTDEIIGKYYSLYKELFKPNIDTAALDAKYLTTPNDGIIIGVHVRRGDYKEFLDGKFYYEDDVYLDKIQQLVTLIGKPYKIIIFTNDPVFNLPAYQEKFDNVVLSSNPTVVDHYLMSKCTYIIGPFSTFSLWASFIGSTPHYRIDNKEEVIRLDKFRICKGTWW
jgi:hypothetical protein